jgi:hypothetical protein
MQRLNPHGFYQFGASMQSLFGLQANQKVDIWNWTLLTAANWIEWTCNSPLLRLRVCTNSGAQLAKQLKDLSAKGPEHVLTQTEISALLVNVMDFQAVLKEELSVSDTYIVAPKGAFSTPTLIENGELLFAEDIRSELPQEAIHDIKQGARCFVFELPTAAGFHFHRAIEAVIHTFYDSLSGGAPRPKRSAMGIYIDELIKLNANAELVATLKQIKDLHRNPVVHPEETLDMNEAQMLMGIMQSAIFSMVKIVMEKKAQTVASTPPLQPTPTVPPPPSP